MNKISLLILDDEQYVLSSLKRLFHSEKYELFTVQKSKDALKILEERPIGVIICDQKLHGTMDGTDFLSIVKKRWPDSSRILLTGYFNSQIAKNSILKGEVYRFISKPWNDEDLKMAIDNSWKRYELLKQNRELLNVIRSQNDHLKHLSLNLKNVIENRIDRLVQSQSAIRSKKIQLQIVHALIKGLNRSKTFNDIFLIVKKALKKLVQFDELSILVQMGATSEPPKPKWKKNGLKSFLLFPLMDDKDPPTCLGSLNLASRKPHGFTEDDSKKLSDILNPIAIAIEKMKLLEIVEQGSRQWESTFDAIGDLVTVIDKNFTLIKANRATEKITHKPVERIIGKKCYEVLANRKSPCRNCPALESFRNKGVTTEHEI